MNTIWRICKPENVLAHALSHELKISTLTAQVLINRGIRSVGESDMFLNPRLGHLRDPMEIPDIDRAARRVLLAKEKGEKILV
ncbi:MAG: single-stranded-DNA-specific exonuclease RecJ, partial [Candidatus Margulisiibacteriota bacterium]